jgi:hypothetical protein
MRAVLIALLLVACKKDDPGPSCEQVTDHMLEVTKQLPGHDGMNMMGVTDRKAMIQQCTQRGYTKQERLCLFQARSIDAFAGCRKTQVPSTLHPPVTPPPGAPAGSGSG